MTDDAPTIAELTTGWRGDPAAIDYVNATTGIIRAYNLISQAQRDALMELDLSIKPFVVISTLARTRDRTLSISALRRLTLIHAATLTSTIARLEERGLVERSIATGDRRSIAVTLTSGGVKLVNQGYRRLSKIKFGLAGLNEEQAAHLAELTEMIDVSVHPTD
jgi:DNA-binding MarR family transcriptional regulator